MTNAWMFLESTADRELFGRNGGLLRDLADDQLYSLYDSEAYSCGDYDAATPTRPYLVTTDSFWELLAAAYEGLFVVTERHQAIPAFWELVAASDQHFRTSQPDSPWANVFATLTKLRDGSGKVASDPEVQRILAARGSEKSPLLGVELNYGELLPRGHYSGDPEFQLYFKAFKYLRKAVYIEFPQAVPIVYTVDIEKCVGCGSCDRVCEPAAISFLEKSEEIEVHAGSIIIATGFEVFEPTELRREYGYGKYENVLTAMQIERMLSSFGPTSGKVLRPSDYKKPKKIGWIQCVGSRSEQLGYPYCSRVCCMYATKEASIVKESNPEIGITIYYMDIRAYGKDFQQYYDHAKKLVANGQEDRLVFLAGFLECLSTPWKPVNRIMGVLQQVGGVFGNQLVRHGWIKTYGRRACKNDSRLSPVPTTMQT